MTKFFKTFILATVILLMASPLSIFACEEGEAEGGVGYYEQQAGEYLHSRSVLHDPSEKDLDLTANVKKEEAIVVMSRLLKVQEKAKNYSTSRMIFTDVPKNSKFAPYIAWAKETGIIKVTTDKKFGFGKELKAVEAEGLLLRTLGYKSILQKDFDQKSKDLGIVQGSMYQWVNTSDYSIQWGDFALFIYNSLYASKVDGNIFGETVGILNKADGNGTTSGNIINGGYFAKQGDWIYFSNFSDNQSLYKMRTDGTGKIKLNYNDSSNIHVIDNWVYYTKLNPYGSIGSGYSYYYVYKVRIDGMDETQVTDENNRDLSIYDGWIYCSNYKDNGKLYKIKLDGTQKVKLTDNVVDDVNVEDGWVYYYNNGFIPGIGTYSGTSSTAGIYRIKTDGTEKIRLSREYGFHVSVADGWIYYITPSNGYKLYKMTDDGKQRSWVGEIKTDSYIVSGEWVYYSNIEDGRKLYKIKLDGTEKTKLSDLYTNSMNVQGDSIYFYSRIGNGKPGAGFAVQYRINTDGTGLQKLEDVKPSFGDLLNRASADKSTFEFDENYTFELGDAFRENIPKFIRELSKLPKDRQNNIINSIVNYFGSNNYIVEEYLNDNRKSTWLTDDEAETVDNLIAEADKYNKKLDYKLNTSTTIDDIWFSTSPLVEENKATLNVTVSNNDISTDRSFTVDVSMDKSLIPIGYAGYADVKIPKGETSAVANITVTLPQAGTYYTRVKVYLQDGKDRYVADRVGKKPDTIFHKLIIE